MLRHSPEIANNSPSTQLQRKEDLFSAHFSVLPNCNSFPSNTELTIYIFIAPINAGKKAKKLLGQPAKGTQINLVKSACLWFYTNCRVN